MCPTGGGSQTRGGCPKGPSGSGGSEVGSGETSLEASRGLGGKLGSGETRRFVKADDGETRDLPQ